MLITVRELQLHRVEFDEHVQPGVIDFGPEVRQTRPLDTAGRADLIEEHRGGRLGTIHDIRLVGEFATQVEQACARCLEPVVENVKRSFDLLYRPQGVDRRGDEAAIHEPDTEIGYYAGEGVLLEDVMREQVLLAVPLRALCREDCKGLCPQCGQNLNAGPCNCAPPPPDARWTALRELKDKL